MTCVPGHTNICADVLSFFSILMSFSLSSSRNLIFLTIAETMTPIKVLARFAEDSPKADGIEFRCLTALIIPPPVVPQASSGVPPAGHPSGPLSRSRRPTPSWRWRASRRSPPCCSSPTHTCGATCARRWPECFRCSVSRLPGRQAHFIRLCSNAKVRACRMTGSYSTRGWKSIFLARHSCGCPVSYATPPPHGCFDVVFFGGEKSLADGCRHYLFLRSPPRVHFA